MSQSRDRMSEERVEAEELAAKYCAERDARYPYNLALINAFIAGHASRDAEVEELRAEIERQKRMNEIVYTGFKAMSRAVNQTESRLKGDSND